MSDLFLLFLTGLWWLMEYGAETVGDNTACYPFSRTSTFSVDLEGHAGRVRELHVRHNLKVSFDGIFEATLFDLRRDAG